MISAWTGHNFHYQSWDSRVHLFYTRHASIGGSIVPDVARQLGIERIESVIKTESRNLEGKGPKRHIKKCDVFDVQSRREHRMGKKASALR